MCSVNLTHYLSDNYNGFHLAAHSHRCLKFHNLSHQVTPHLLAKQAHVTMSVRENEVYNFIPHWLFKWRLVATFLNTIRISTPLIFHPLELVSKLFNINFQRSQTLCRFRSTMFVLVFFNSFEDIISSRTIIISSKTPLFSCRLFHCKRVQFVTKLIFLFCQDDVKILEHCLYPCPNFFAVSHLFSPPSCL